MMPRTGTSSVQTRNNFDLIRLFAAAQVAVSHLVDWMDGAVYLEGEGAVQRIKPNPYTGHRSR